MSPRIEVDPLRRALASTWDKATDRPDCPDESRLFRASRGELTGDEFLVVLDHVTGCPACQRSWSLATELENAGAVRAGPVLSASRWMAPLGAVAAIAIVAVGAWYFVDRGELSAPSSTRFRAESEIRIDSLLDATVPLPRDRCLLRWTALEGEPRYDLVVTTERLDPVLSTRALAAAEFLIPAEALRALGPATPLLWRVEARFPDGSRIRSETFHAALD